MKVTMQQIADAVGVSRGTVDRAFHHRGRIDPDVEERIFRTAKELGYPLERIHAGAQKRSGAGKLTAGGREIRIGVITYLCHAGFMQEINRGIRKAQEELQEWGVRIILRESDAVSEEQQLAFLDEVLEEGIDGLAIMPIDTGTIRQRLYDIGQTSSMPIVMFNSDLQGVPRMCYVGMDNFRSGQTAAGLMNMLTGGTGRVLVITGTFSNQLNNARVDGFTQEVRDSFPGLTIAAVQSSYDNEEEVRAIVENMMKSIPGINGIFIVSSGQSGIRSVLAQDGSGSRPGVIVYDQTPKNEKLMRDGLVDFLIDQNGFEQGYRPLHILANAIKGNSEPEPYSEFTEISIKTKYNL